MAKTNFSDINRVALVIKLKKPFIDWLVYTSKEHDGQDHELKSEEVITEGFDSKHVYLVPVYDDIDDYEKFLKKHCCEIFEQELDAWYTDSRMWPRDRSWKVFKEWFDYEIQTVVLDMASDEPTKD